MAYYGAVERGVLGASQGPRSHKLLSTKALLAMGLAGVALLAVVGVSVSQSSSTSQLLEIVPARYPAGSAEWMNPVPNSQMLWTAFNSYVPPSQGNDELEDAGQEMVKAKEIAGQLQNVKDAEHDLESRKHELGQQELDLQREYQETIAHAKSAVDQVASNTNNIHRVQQQAYHQPHQQQARVPLSDAGQSYVRSQQPPQMQQQPQVQQQNVAKRIPVTDAQQAAHFNPSTGDGGLSWMPEMGTDISFIPTADFPQVMAGGGHNQHPDQLKDDASQVSNLVMKKLEPQMQKQQSELQRAREEISRLKAQAAAAHLPPISAKAPKTAKLAKKTLSQLHTKPAPPKAEQPKMVAAPKQESKQAQFKNALADFMKAAGVPAKKQPALKKSGVVKGNQKSMKDYGFDPEGEDGEEEWEHEHMKGRPCSVAGGCNHGVFTLQDDKFWMDRHHKRFADEEEEDDDGEKVALGDHQVLGSLDDYVPADDAYVHNLLTSSGYGIDHFGKLAPLSKENVRMMYGRWWGQLEKNVNGHPVNAPGRGGPLSPSEQEEQAAAEAEETGEEPKPKVVLGDDQIGQGQDHEVPAALAHPAFPGSDHDHFGHLKYDSPENQQLLNGRYWKYIKEDGHQDRYMPADEAYSQQSGASHDRTLSDNLDLHHYGWNHAGGYEKARKELDGDDWKHHVFTGTDEIIEEEKGTKATKGIKGEYFKGKTSSLRKSKTQKPAH